MAFDPKRVKDELVEWIFRWFEQNGPGCCAVVGISGGKDSSVVAALCAEALGASRVVGVLMPNGEQPDIHMSHLLVDTLHIPSYTLNIAQAYDACLKQIEQSGVPISQQTRINLAPRLRMSIEYALSQSLNGRVANTCNWSEDYVGYATRYGDGAGDFAPLGRLVVREVKAIGHALGLPRELVEKVPSDGLCGQTDEDNLGFSYALLDRYIREGVCEDEEIRCRIDRLHEQNLFKLKPIPFFPYSNQ